MLVLFVGGGTGGHFYPLISIAEALNTAPQKPLLYYAGPDSYDSDALKKEGITFIKISAGKQRRYTSILNFFDIFKVLFGFLVAIVKLYILYPDVVMSKGGYTSVPVVLAASFLRIPIIIHESDAVAGKANILASKFAQDIITNYDSVHFGRNDFKIHQLGIPVRASLFSDISPEAYTRLGVDQSRPIILILGGSQGAERVNTLILDALDELLPDFTVIHQTGKLNYELCKLSAENLISDETQHAHYHPFPFLQETALNDAYHIAHIIISRAGSNSIYEIALHGKPSILIPIPEEISHDQRTNAYAYARYGAATVMEEKNLTDGLLRAEIDRIMQDPSLYEQMSESARTFGKRDTAEKIKDLILNIAEKH